MFIVKESTFKGLYLTDKLGQLAGASNQDLLIIET